MPLSARNSCLARVWHSCDVLLFFFFVCVFCPLEIGCGGGVCVVSAGALVFFPPPQSVQDTRAERRYLDMATFHTIVPSFRNNGHRLRSRRHERSVSLHNFRLEESVQVFFCFVSLVMRSCRLQARICVHNVLVFAEFMVPSDISTSSSSHARGVDVCVSGRRFVVRSHVSFEVRVSVVRRGAHAVVRGVRLVSLEHLHDVGRRLDCRVHY